MSTHLLALILGIVGLAIGPVLAAYASKRTTKQPVSLELKAERKTLASVLRNPSGYVFVAELKGEHFVDETNGKLWAAIVTACSDVKVPEPGEKAKVFEKASVNVPSDLLEKVKSANPSLLELISELEAENAKYEERPLPLERKALLKEAGKVFNAAADRTSFAGAAILSPGGDGEELLVRRYEAPSKGRKIFFSALLAGAGAASPWLANASTEALSLSWYFAVAAIFSLAVFSLVWAFVDHDTMYLDYPSFFIGAGLAWTFTVLSAWAADDYSRLLAGILVVVGVAIVFEGGSFVYSLVRGTPGMGFGDTVIAVATVGVPAALTGSWTLGYWVIIASMIFAIIGRGVSYARNKTGAEVPFALGPYLALGWVGAFTIMNIIGLNSLDFI